MTSSTLAYLNAVIKELWPQSAIDSLAFSEIPLLAFVNKKTDFSKKVKHIALQFGNPQGRNANFAIAQANGSASKFADWLLTRVDDYAVGQLDSVLIESIDSVLIASAKDKKAAAAALVDALKNQIGGSLTELNRSLHKALFGNGSGVLGQADGAGAAAASDTLTLTSVEDVASFSPGMTVVLSALDDGTGVIAGKEVIKAVDRDTGTITSTSPAWNTVIVGALDNMYVYVDGEPGKKVVGLDGWLPATPPGAALFFGVDRSIDPVSLGGIRYDGSADGTKKEALENAAGRLMREGNGANPTHIFMNPTDAQKLNIELGSQRVYEDLLGKGTSGKAVNFGFKAVVMSTMCGNLSVIPDYQCPIGVAYMLDMSTWTFYSMGGVPQLFEEDGLTIFRRAPNSDGYEYLAAYRGNLVCTAPGRNVRVKLP